MIHDWDVPRDHQGPSEHRSQENPAPLSTPGGGAQSGTNGRHRRRRWRMGWGSPQAGAGESAFPLGEARIEETLWIVDIEASPELRDKLTSMGLHRGCELRVVLRGDRGSHLVAVAHARLGLDEAMSRAIRVRRSGIAITPGAPPGPIGSPDSATTMTSNTPADHPPSAAASGQERLQDLPVGSRGRVEGYRQGSRTYRQRLLSMGLTPGTEFEVTRQAPLGDPVELRVRGFSLMLRKQEADMLIIAVTHHG